MSKRALLIAFHFPPIKISSGLERTLAMTRHLPKFGWEPLVLSASPKAYPAVSDERLGQIPAGTVVERAFARDAVQLLSIAGKYPAWITVPDRWQSWILGAIPTGLSMIRKYRPEVIWSTYPITSAHIIAYYLSRLSGIPWVADFRDPMVEFDSRTGIWWPRLTPLRNARLRVEQMAMRQAAALTFCTDTATRICRERDTSPEAKLWQVVPNGFDETAFVSAQARVAAPSTSSDLVLVHSGTIYPTSDRDPTHFFHGLKQVLERRGQRGRRVRIILRASAVDALYAPLIKELGLSENVEFAPAIPYEDALAEMMGASGVMIFQGDGSNPAIPAKLYEYFRAGRPILALADDEGETAKLIRSIGAGMIAPLNDADQIAAALGRFLELVEDQAWQPLSADVVASFERGNSVQKFAELFTAVTAQAHKP